MGVASGGCGIGWVWHQVGEESGGCGNRWVWHQVGVASSGCGIRWCSVGSGGCGTWVRWVWHQVGVDKVPRKMCISRKKVSDTHTDTHTDNTFISIDEIGAIKPKSNVELSP